MSRPDAESSVDDLATRIVRGDPDAEEELVARYRPGLLVLLRHRGAARDAQDLCHETLRVAIEHLRAGRLQQKEKLSAYLWGIATRLADRAHERRDRERPAGDLVYERADLSPGPEEAVLSSERARRVRAALMALARRDREVLRAFYLEDQPKQQICRALGLSPSQFDVIKFRALRRLARVWR